MYVVYSPQRFKLNFSLDHVGKSNPGDTDVIGDYEPRSWCLILQITMKKSGLKLQRHKYVKHDARYQGHRCEQNKQGRGVHETYILKGERGHKEEH